MQRKLANAQGETHSTWEPCQRARPKHDCEGNFFVKHRTSLFTVVKLMSLCFGIESAPVNIYDSTMINLLIHSSRVYCSYLAITAIIPFSLDFN